VYVSGDVTHGSATSIPDDPAALRRALMRMIDERDSAVRERDETAKAHEALIGRVTSLEHKCIVLEHDNRKLLLRIYGKKSERLCDADLVLFHGFMQEELARSGDPVPDADDSAEGDGAAAGKKKRKRTGRPSGEDAIPGHLAASAELKMHELTVDQRGCSSCGAQMQACGETTRMTLEYVPAKITAVRHMRVAYSCGLCTTFAAAPAAPIPVQKSIASCGLLAAVIVGKYCDHLPLYRLEGILKRSGVELTRQTTCGWMYPASQLLAPLVSLARRMILAAPVILTDDTPVKLLDPGLGKTREARFWSYLADVKGAGGVPERLAVYQFTRNRNHEHPIGFLRNFHGTLVSDAFAGYVAMGKGSPAQLRNAGCWAHARRRFRDALKLDERLCGEALARIGAMYQAERGVSERIARETAEAAAADDAWSMERTAERRAALRGELVAPLVSDVLSMLDSVRRKHLPKSEVSAAVEYVMKRREWFTRFLEDGNVPIDNNACERSLRGIAVGRRNWLFVGSQGGGDAASVFFSVLCSASLAEVEPWAYLRDVLERLATLRNARRPARTPWAPTEAELAELLPAAWLRANPEHRLAVNRTVRNGGSVQPMRAASFRCGSLTLTIYHRSTRAVRSVGGRSRTTESGL